MTEQNHIEEGGEQSRQHRVGSGPRFESGESLSRIFWIHCLGLELGTTANEKWVKVGEQ